MATTIEPYELLPIGKTNSYEGIQAIGTNYIHIEKQLIARNDPHSKDGAFIHRAAVWNYRYHGYGCVSLSDYLEYLDYLKGKQGRRLHLTNNEVWRELANKVFLRDNYTCTYCGQIGGILECDHVTPISKGGSDELSNLTTSCRKCNRQKKDKTVDEFNNWKASKNLSI